MVCYLKLVRLSFDVCGSDVQGRRRSVAYCFFRLGFCSGAAKFGAHCPGSVSFECGVPRVLLRNE